jgi:MFS transporter, DHA3 family, macrolide efflux protein
MKKLYTLYILIITQGISLIGSRMSSISMGIWLYKQYGKATFLLLIPFFNELPAMAAGSLSGVWIDGFKRKTILILSDLGQAICTTALFVLLSTQRFQLWHLYVIVILQGALAAFQGPTADAVTTMLCEKTHRERANALKEMLFPFAGIAAPALAGIVYGLLGITGVMIIDLATFVISVITLSYLGIPEPEKNRNNIEIKDSFFKELSYGIKFLTDRKSLFLLVIYFSLTNFLLNGPLELAIPYLLKVTGSELKMSFFLMLMNVGAFLGALLLSILGGTKLKINTLMPGMLLNGLMMIIFGFTRMPTILGTSLLLMMLPLPVCNAVFMSLLQSKTPPNLQGRVFSIVSQLTMIGTPISFLITGPLVDKILEPRFITLPGSGMGILLSTTGLVIFVFTLAFYRLPNIRRLETDLPDYF